MQLNVVLLPEPFGPISPRISPSFNAERDVVDRLERAEPLAQAPDIEQRHLVQRA